MALQKYHQKRDFTKTPEPSGKKDSRNRRPEDQLVFMLHKHDASRLHYDLRLELDGVLKSWAVPKGPSTNPKEKRLAMEVEDHPFSYRNFEGVIPEGNYGAGTALIWDEGKYEPIHGHGKDDEEVIRSQYKHGELKLRFFGKKLRGEYVLVRIKAKEGKSKKVWLLIKHDDDFAGVDYANDELSVRSGRSLAEVAAGEKQRKLVWPETPRSLEADITNLKTAKLPKSIKPMLATLTSELPVGDQWLYEVKWDGYRALAEIDNGKVSLYSRNGLNFNDSYPDIVTALEKLPGKMLFDGEVVAVDEHGVSKFQLLQNSKNNSEQKLIYYVFDILYFDKFDLRSLALSQRREILEQVFKPSSSLQLSETYNDGHQLLEAAEQLGFEGIIAKHKQSSYELGRSSKWLKIKLVLEREFVIGGYTAPQGERKGFGSLLVGEYHSNQFVYKGRVGTGFNADLITELKSKFDKHLLKNSPFADIPREIERTAIAWVKPKFVAQVKFSEWTSDKYLRQPVFLGLRRDKAAKDITSEPIIKMKEASEVIITHPDKLYWPEDKLTKQDLIDYYDRVSATIMPYLMDRPQNLNRFPNGIHGESFYQKDFDQAHPDWLQTEKVYSESTGEYIDYVICQNKETLLYLANLGCIEINPWNSRLKSLDKPDYILFDLDPVEVEFADVVKVANVLHELLEKLKLPQYPKTSGKRGLHIYLPLGAQYHFEPVRIFAELIAQKLRAILPELVSLERSPEDRKGKVYIDYLQNRKGQTTATAYSVRPVAGATVSTPLKWDEVNSKLSPKKFTIKNTPQRIEKVGDLWEGLLTQKINIEAALNKLEGN